MTRRWTVMLKILDSRFRVASDDPRMSEALALLWEPFLTRSDGDRAGEMEFRVLRVAEGWSVETDDYPGGQSPDPWTVLSVLRNLLSGRAIRSAESIVPLHGAAVERDGKVLVLSGPARSGKTTLMLALLEAGWTYVTDDLIPIDPESLTAAPFPKPLSIRDPGLWERFTSRWAVPPWLPPPDQVGLVPPSAFPGHPEPYVPDVLLFPRYEPGGQPALEALSSAAAVARAADNLHVPSADPATLKALARLGTTVSAYAAGYGSTEKALELLEKCLAARQPME